MRYEFIIVGDSVAEVLDRGSNVANRLSEQAADFNFRVYPGCLKVVASTNFYTPSIADMCDGVNDLKNGAFSK